MQQTDIPSENGQTEEHCGERTLFVGAKWALIGGVVAAGIAIFGLLAIGQVYSGTEARGLINAMIPSTRSVGTGVVTTSSTILALMLAMLSLSSKAKTRMQDLFYRRVERVGFLSTIALFAALLMLVLLSIPIEQSKNVPNSWFSFVYYFIIVYTAALAGLMVAIVLMLFNAMQSLIEVISPTKRQKEQHKVLSQTSKQHTRSGEQERERT